MGLVDGTTALLAALSAAFVRLGMTGLLLARSLTLACLLLARLMLAGLMLARLLLAGLHLAVLAGSFGVARAIPLTLLTASVLCAAAGLAPVIADAVLVFLVHSESSIL